MRFTIGLKLAMTFGIVILLSGLNVWVGMNGLRDTVQTYEEEALRIAETARLSEEFEKLFNALDNAALGYLFFSSEKYRADFDAAFLAVEELAVKLRNTMRSDYAREIVDVAITRVREYVASMASILERFYVAGTQEYDQALTWVEIARVQVAEAIGELSDYQARRLEEIREDSDAAVHRAQTLMIVFGIIVTVIGIVVAFLFTRGIAGPARQVAAAAMRLADGDLTIEELQIKSRDEIGEMAKVFNQMVVNLREIIGQIRATSQTLYENGESLLLAAEESTGATAQIAAAVNQVAQGTTEQVRPVQETRTAIEQLRRIIDQIATGAQEQAQQAEQTTRSLERMAQSIEEVSSSVRAVAEASGHGAERAMAGEKTIVQVTQGMDEIRTSVIRVAERIDELGRYSRQIDEIVEMISAIADQTNLLALNAAIEAARAGEHGRGFGVVADEVRQLAERSAESTREIGQLLASIQAAVDSAIAEVQAATKQVDSGTQLAGHARAAFDEIMANIRTTDDLARTISQAAEQMAQASPEMLAAMAEMASITEENTTATEEMAAFSDQVVRAIDEVAAISEETAAGTEEVSASTEEVNASAEGMKESVQKVTEVAANLEKLVGHFRL